MKRLAVLTLLAVSGLGGAADPLPLPTGFAPTAPRVPVPATRNGVLVPVAAADAPVAGAVQMAGFWNGLKASPAAITPARGPQVWCTDCAPAVRHPLPPLPATAPCGTAAACPAGATAAATTGRDWNCWDRFKAWVCYRPTPIHLPLNPTPRMTPFYVNYLCAEKAGCADGNCGPNGCAGAGAAGVLARIGGRAPARGCTTCPQPGEGVMPGYRFAEPSNAAPSAPAPTTALPAGDVIPTGGFRIPTANPPTATVPYRATGTTQPAPAARPASR